jgi:hypothetical protein
VVLPRRLNKLQLKERLEIPEALSTSFTLIDLSEFIPMCRTGLAIGSSLIASTSEDWRLTT